MRACWNCCSGPSNDKSPCRFGFQKCIILVCILYHIMCTSYAVVQSSVTHISYEWAVWCQHQFAEEILSSNWKWRVSREIEPTFSHTYKAQYSMEVSSPERLSTVHSSEQRLYIAKPAPASTSAFNLRCASISRGLWMLLCWPLSMILQHCTNACKTGEHVSSATDTRSLKEVDFCCCDGRHLDLRIMT